LTGVHTLVFIQVSRAASHRWCGHWRDNIYHCSGHVAVFFLMPGFCKYKHTCTLK